MSNLGNFVWSITNQHRGVYKPHQYGDVILPLTILRRGGRLSPPRRVQRTSYKTITDLLTVPHLRSHCFGAGP